MRCQSAATNDNDNSELMTVTLSQTGSFSHRLMPEEIATPAAEAKAKANQRMSVDCCGRSLSRLISEHRLVEAELETAIGRLHQVALNEVDAAHPQCRGALGILHPIADDLDAAAVRIIDE